MSSKTYDVKISIMVNQEYISNVLKNPQKRKIEKPKSVPKTKLEPEVQDFSEIYTGQMRYMDREVNLIIQNLQKEPLPKTNLVPEVQDFLNAQKIKIEKPKPIPTTNLVSEKQDFLNVQKTKIEKLNPLPKTKLEPEEQYFSEIYTGKMRYMDREVNLIIQKMQKGIRVSIPDVRLEPGVCSNVAKEFTKKLYKESTGKELGDDQIEVREVGDLVPCSCEKCSNPPLGFPSKCRVCGGYFCKGHINDHGCNKNKDVEATAEKEINEIKTEEAENQKNQILIQEVPCG